MKKCLLFSLEILELETSVLFFIAALFYNRQMAFKGKWRLRRTGEKISKTNCYITKKIATALVLKDSTVRLVW